MAFNNRVVHARCGDGEVVRYDRTGKYYLENELERRRVTLAEAVEFAVQPGVVVLLGRYGGTRFDAEVRKRRARGRT
ncbi:hypothetical protein [Leucobacter sp. cx-169]|uniref:hypothetical protein n=1 Tax=Leucobacter sp. cx-169 TaxID=2770549 RepID=UPI00165E0310|nr:hypothetical protein [Leucobacter sp. cx-169]MBC9927207.1 hypothetical protein [Leucobacter sp. cx-169]